LGGSAGEDFQEKKVQGALEMIGFGHDGPV
jgi:hypothetical protein